jgi:release factor glutamine methyltransferase
VIFNPPYVPTLSEESSTAQTSRGIEGAWAGGNTGMEITNSFLEVVSELLSSKGYFYLVALKANDIDGIRQKMLAEFNLQSEVSKDRSARIAFHVSSRIDCPRAACGKRTFVHNSICSDLKVEAIL